jgi:hypothetical protein
MGHWPKQRGFNQQKIEILWDLTSKKLVISMGFTCEPW